MATEKLEIPTIQFGFYYPEFLTGLMEYKHTNIPELSDDDPHEPANQLIRAFALVGHSNNCLIDLVAQESMLETARLTESVREHLKLAGYRMSAAKPSKVDMICQLSKNFVSSTILVPEGARFSTEFDPVSKNTIYFESDRAIAVSSTATLSGVISVESGVAVEYTTEANSTNTPDDDFTPWSSITTGDAIYFGHSSVMFDRLDVYVTTAVEDDGYGVWEYYSGDYEKANPDSIEQNNNRLVMVVDGYLGTENREGTEIRVVNNRTNISEDVIVIWTGDNNVIQTNGLLGQSEVSFEPGDYTIGSAWEELKNVSSDSGVGDLYFGLEDSIRWPLPQSVTNKWNQTQIVIDEETVGQTGYWVRFRWIVAPPNLPVIQYVSIAEANKYILVSATQGQTFTQSPLGSSTGAANQTFTGQRNYFIDGGSDVLTVNDEEWVRVDNFILSGPADQHYVIELTGDSDTPVVKFGDGVRGAIPQVGVNNIDFTYRYGANVDGNVGPNTITVDQTGLSYVSGIYNPRQAYGWSAAEGSTEASLALAKQLGPATIRAKEVAISPDDLVSMTLRFIDDSGASPYSRAFYIEEGFGPKTVELVVVQKGGGTASNDQLQELSTFFNGDKFATPPIPSRFVANQKVIATNYTPRTINVIVKVTASIDLSAEIANKLLEVLNPEALMADGTTNEWEFGSMVTKSRLSHEVHSVSNKIIKVEVIEPASDIQLSYRQLPKAGSVTVTMVAP